MTIPVYQIPDGVEIAETEGDVSQEQLREIDRQRKIDDPTFKGAFHDKKRRITNDRKDYTDKFTKKKSTQTGKKRR